MDQTEAQAALKNPMTPAAVIADIAYQFPDMRAEVAAHPGAYPGLLDWLDSVGDAGVKAAVSARRTADAALNPPANNEPADLTVYKPLEPTPAPASGPEFAPYSPEVPSPLGSIAPAGAEPVPAEPGYAPAEPAPVVSTYVPAPAPIEPTYVNPSAPTETYANEPAYTPVEPAYTPVEPVYAPTAPQYAPQYQRAYPMDAPSAGFAVLGFFIPVVGLILYLVWKDQTPLKARSAGKGALISVIVTVAFYLLMIIIVAANS